MTKKAYLNKRNKDSLIQVWLDRRYIATGARWLQENGVHPRFMSDVFKFIFEGAIDNLVNSKQVKFVESTIDAIEFLDEQFKNNLNPKGKGLKNLAKNLQIEQQDNFTFDRTESEIGNLKNNWEEEMKKHVGKFKKSSDLEDHSVE